MAKSQENGLNKGFIIFLAIIIGVVIYYVCLPSEKPQEKKLTFEEMLESTNAKSNKPTQEYVEPKRKQKESKKVNNQQDSPRIIKQKETPKRISENTYKQQTTTPQIENNSDYVKTVGINTYDQKFDMLLDNLEKYPSRSISSVETIINKILIYKGYSAGTVRVATDERNGLKAETQGSYIAAVFNIQTGYIHINKAALNTMNIKDVIAILAHELDHFDKVAQVCKSIGYDEFIKLLEDNQMKNINKEFWRRAPYKANIKDFKTDYYKQALVRFLSQGTIDLASTYADLYRLAENMRNPLELSAYEVSDYVYNYYGIPINAGPMRKLIEQFNKVDWALYNLIKNDYTIEPHRIAFFDYYFAQAIIEQNQKYRQAYDYCISKYDGDLTGFWWTFEGDHRSLYDRGAQINPKTYASIMVLLQKTQQKIQGGMSDRIVKDALKFKANTLLNNIVYPNAIKNIQTAASSYLEYTKSKNVEDAYDELHMILTLICIENDLTKNSNQQIPSLYYIKIPQKISNLYGIISSGQKFKFIYENKAFLDEFNRRKQTNPNLTEQVLLYDLLNEKRLNVKFKK